MAAPAPASSRCPGPPADRTRPFHLNGCHRVRPPRPQRTPSRWRKPGRTADHELADCDLRQLTALASSRSRGSSHGHGR
jgi:hypothetical protein